MNSPDGDHTGFRSWTASFVTQTELLVTRSKTRMSNFVRSMFWNTILVPSGDQRGRTWFTPSELSEVNCRGLCPRLSTAHILRGPAHEASKAICLPSGEYSGLNAFCT